MCASVCVLKRHCFTCGHFYSNKHKILTGNYCELVRRSPLNKILRVHCNFRKLHFTVRVLCDSTQKVFTITLYWCPSVGGATCQTPLHRGRCSCRRIVQSWRGCDPAGFSLRPGWKRFHKGKWDPGIKALSTLSRAEVPAGLQLLRTGSRYPWSMV